MMSGRTYDLKSQAAILIVQSHSDSENFEVKKDDNDDHLHCVIRDWDIQYFIM